MTMRKLVALDEDDLAVVSAHVQDASVHVADIIWRQGEKRLVIGMRRPDCDELVTGKSCSHRLVSALRFDRVLACKARNLDLERRDLVLELLGLEFHPGRLPGGSVLLMFAGGEALRLDVECIECELADLGEDALNVAEPDGDDQPVNTGP